MVPVVAGTAVVPVVAVVSVAAVVPMMAVVPVATVVPVAAGKAGTAELQAVTSLGEDWGSYCPDGIGREVFAEVIK